MKLPQIKLPNIDNVMALILNQILNIPLVVGIIDGVWYVCTSHTLINHNWDWYAVALVIALSVLGVAFSKYLRDNKE